MTESFMARALALAIGLLLLSAPAHAQSSDAEAQDELPPCPRFEVGTLTDAEGAEGATVTSPTEPGDAAGVESSDGLEDCAPLPMEIVSVGQLKSSLWTDAYVEVYNPNRDHGLVRSDYELAWLDEDGGIITVTGQGGLPGAGCCTIYQLPPGGKYIFTTLGGMDDRPVDAELAVFGGWHYWPDLDSAGAVAEGTRARVKKSSGKDSTATVTGRVGVEQPGPVNVIVQAKLGNKPNNAVVLEDVVHCVEGDQRRAFELSYFGRVHKKAEVQEVWAYPTTVAGAEGTLQEAPGCD